MFHMEQCKVDCWHEICSSRTRASLDKRLGKGMRQERHKKLQNIFPNGVANIFLVIRILDVVGFNFFGRFEMVIDFNGEIKKVRRIKNSTYYIDLTTWTRPAFGVAREGRDISLYLGMMSVGWSRKPRPHGIDNAVGTVRSFLIGNSPRSVFLGPRFRSRTGLKTFFSVNAKNWR